MPKYKTKIDWVLEKAKKKPNEYVEIAELKVDGHFTDFIRLIPYIHLINDEHCLEYLEFKYIVDDVEFIPEEFHWYDSYTCIRSDDYCLVNNYIKVFVKGNNIPEGINPKTEIMLEWFYLVSECIDMSFNEYVNPMLKWDKVDDV